MNCRLFRKRWFLLFGGVCFMIACDLHPFKHGEILYENFCANCHMEDGKGLKGLIPPLAGSDYLQKERDNVPCLIRHGIKDTIAVNGQLFYQEMTAITQLSDFEIANVINYINHAWGNDFGYTTIDEIQGALEACE